MPPRMQVGTTSDEDESQRTLGLGAGNKRPALPSHVAATQPPPNLEIVRRRRLQYTEPENRTKHDKKCPRPP